MARHHRTIALGTVSQSRMALGDKAVDGGGAPHELRQGQGQDKGTLVVAGDGVKLAPGQSSMTLRTHFIGGDAVTLADLAEVLVTEPVPVADIPALLRDLAPDYKPYAGLSGKALREQLATLGVKVASTGNRYPVDPAEIRKALALRPVEDAD